MRVVKSKKVLKKANPMIDPVGRVGDRASETVALSVRSGDAAAEHSAAASLASVDREVISDPGEVEDSVAQPIDTNDDDVRHSANGGEDLAAPAVKAQLGARLTLRGSIDKVTRTQIRGWVWDPKSPDERINLELIEGDVQVVTAVASVSRPDLVPAGIGDGRHAFSIDLKPGMLSSEKHVLHLRCADTGVAVPGSPVVVDLSPDPRKDAFRWHLDQITDQAVSGWIVPRDGPLRHCVVALKEGGTLLGRAVASQFRADLLSAGIGDGCHAFKLPMPRSLLDGEPHQLEIVEEATGIALTDELVQWRSTAGTAGTELTGIGAQMREPSPDSLARRPPVERLPSVPGADYDVSRPPDGSGKRLAAAGKPGSRNAAHVGTRILFDISDLVYYLGHHPNLTGIQRVQSSIVLSMIDGEVVAPSSILFLSFNARTKNWVAIPTGFLISLLRDLFQPEAQRLISFPTDEASDGILPGAQPFDGIGMLDDGNPSVLCLLGAAWVNQDYVHHVLAWKRRFGTRFVMTVHDLIPIYARDTCDQDTVRVFEEFMRRALRHVDHILAVSENTAKDVRRYLTTLKLPEPAITVTKNGAAFSEFMPESGQTGDSTVLDLPERFVLMVATIEGRKNHRLILDVWRRMIEQGEDPPHLICVGRLGWKATAFLSVLVETNYLDGRVHLLRDISDTDLCSLYKRCLFTVYPTFYEGWGLPVGESLAMGKICVSSDRTSIPEVAGECGVYINIDSVDQSLEVIRNLIRDDKARRALEAKIRRNYVPITWRSVAERVVSACEASVLVEWPEPYPYTLLPYSTEISFGRLDPDMDGSGEPLLSRMVDARVGYFKYEPLAQQNFLLGAEIRSGGVWSLPERWGTWICRSGGDIAFGLSAEPVVWVWLRIRVCDVLHEHPMRLLANGERLWEGRIGSRSRDIMVRIRKPAGAASTWRLRIGVEFDLSPELGSRIVALDGRMPTVGFERLIVVPESDVTTRLDVISKLVMSRQ